MQRSSGRIQPPDSSTFWEKRNAGRRAFSTTQSQAFSLKRHSYVAPAGAWSPLATGRAASIALPSEGFPAGPSAARIRGRLGTSELPQTRLRPDPARGRLPRRGVTPASYSRELFPWGRSWQQVPGEQGGAGWSRAPRRPVNQRRRAPGRPPWRSQCWGGEAGAADYQPLRDRPAGEG